MVDGEQQHDPNSCEEIYFTGNWNKKKENILVKGVKIVILKHLQRADDELNVKYNLGNTDERC